MNIRLWDMHNNRDKRTFVLTRFAPRRKFNSNVRISPALLTLRTRQCQRVSSPICSPHPRKWLNGEDVYLERNA